LFVPTSLTPLPSTQKSVLARCTKTLCGDEQPPSPVMLRRNTGSKIMQHKRSVTYLTLYPIFTTCPHQESLGRFPKQLLCIICRYLKTIHESLFSIYA